MQGAESGRGFSEHMCIPSSGQASTTPRARADTKNTTREFRTQLQMAEAVSHLWWKSDWVRLLQHLTGGLSKVVDLCLHRFSLASIVHLCRLEIQHTKLFILPKDSTKFEVCTMLDKGQPNRIVSARLYLINQCLARPLPRGGKNNQEHDQVLGATAGTPKSPEGGGVLLA